LDFSLYFCKRNLKLIYCLIKIDLIMGNPAYGKGFEAGKKVAEEATKKILQNKDTQTIVVAVLSAIAGGIATLLGSRK